MARSLNRAELIGNLGADPEIRSTTSGTRVATLSVATNRTWTDRQGQQQEKTEWHRVVCWERLAEICEQYLSRGDRVYIDGSIEYRSFEGQDGQTKYVTEIRAREMIMLGGRGGSVDADVPRASSRGGSQPEGGAASSGGPASGEGFSNDELSPEDDLPF
ncbi:MAG: single-stranded DNA-binding protein [Gemmatimonadota bacterium]|nr:single-stranded DNA-binding protein [Gemmatimonadota bacterium]